MGNYPQAPTYWLHSYGWLMLLVLFLWVLATCAARLAFSSLRTRQALAAHVERLGSYARIKLDTLSFLVRWSLLLLFLLTEAYLFLGYLQSAFPSFYAEHAESIRLWISHAKALALIFISFLALQRLAQLVYESVLARVAGQENASPEEKSLRARTLLGVLRGVVTTILLIAAALAILAQFDRLRLLAPLLTGAGLAGIAVAFAVQSLIRDFFSGFFILLENQYRIGDMVRIGERSGTVECVSLRTTHLRDENGALHILPNSEVKSLSNMSRGWAQVIVDVPLPSSYSPERVLDALQKAADTFFEHSRYGQLLVEKPCVLGIDSLSGTSLLYRVALKTRAQAHSCAAREFRRHLVTALLEEGMPLNPAC